MTFLAASSHVAFLRWVLAIPQGFSFSSTFHKYSFSPTPLNRIDGFDDPSRPVRDNNDGVEQRKKKKKSTSNGDAQFEHNAVIRFSPVQCDRQVSVAALTLYRYKALGGPAVDTIGSI